MKRLLASGHKKIYQICRCFRQDERGQRHLPEFTLLEWYGTGMDYFDLMDQCQELLQHVAGVLNMGKKMPYQGKTIDLSPPWPRLTVREAFDRFGSLTLDSAMEQNRFDEILTESVEPRLGVKKPVFLLFSGPSMGPVAGKYYCEHLKIQNCIIMDMGGTSFDVSTIINGQMTTTREGRIRNYPTGVSATEILTLG